MATVVPRPKVPSSPLSERSCVGGSNCSSKSSSLMPLLESESCCDDGSGFQRGFLLSKSKRAKGSGGRIQSQKATNSVSPKSSITTTTTTTTTKVAATTATIAETKPSVSLLASALPLIESATSVVKYNESKTKTITAKQNSPFIKASEKKDSGWTKGFLINKKKKRTTVTAEGEKSNEGSNIRKSKVRIPIDVPSNKKDLSWSTGFLTNKNISKKEKKVKDGTRRNLLNKNYDFKTERGEKEQPSLTGNHPKAILSSDILLSIDDDDDDRYRRKAAQIFAPAKTTPRTASTTGNAKSLISVVFDESANETVSSPDSLQQPHQKSTFNCNEIQIKGNVEGPTMMSTAKPLVTPLISIVREDEEYEEEKPSSIFIKEVSTKRKPNHERSEHAELVGGREQESCYSPQKINGLSMENMKGESPYHKPTIVSTIVSADLSNKKDEKEEVSESSRRNDDDSNNFLRFQQELERLCSRPPKLSQRKECEGRVENGDLETILMQFRTPEHRRYAWIYLLQQKQHQQYQHECRTKIGGDKSECNYMIRELFDAEFFHYRQSRHKIIIHDYDNNNDGESPLESIMRCVETESDKKLALHAVLITQEYFIFRYKGQGRHQQYKVPQSSMNRIVDHAQAERIQRLMSLFVRLTILSSGGRRTLLTQTAWETAILIFCFCTREFSGVPPPSSSSSSSSLFYTLPATFWEKLDSLLYQQLVWQQSKSKLNTEKIIQLQEVKTKSKNILNDINTQKEMFNSSLELLQELAADLERLIRF